MPYSNIAVIGASGTLGKLLVADLKEQSFKVTALARAESKSTFPSGVKVVTIASSFPHAELVEAFKGNDAVVCAIGMGGMELQETFIVACIEAGVSRFYPTEFGLEHVPDEISAARPAFKYKHDLRDYLVSREKDGLEWTSIVCNLLFPFAIRIGIDVPGRKATIVGGGDIPFAVTSYETVAKAIVGSLKNEVETRNKVLAIKDFDVTQNQLLDGLKARLGGDWAIDTPTLDAYHQKAIKDIQAGNGSATSNLLFVHILKGNTFSPPKLFNDLLEAPAISFEQLLEAETKSF